MENPAARERLKEAKGIGTPATRAEIIKGLKRQNLLAADGKWVLPTSAGLQVFEVLRDAAPALVDPGTTAEWEMQLDAVVTGKADHRRVRSCGCLACGGRFDRGRGLGCGSWFTRGRRFGGRCRFCPCH